MSARPDTVARGLRVAMDAGALLRTQGAIAAGVLHSPLGEAPWLYLDLEACAVLAPSDAARSAVWLRERPCPVIGIAGAAATGALASACDALVADDAGGQVLLDNIARTPLAAMTLVHVLRTTERRPVGEALVIESLGFATVQGGPEFRAWLAARTDRTANATASARAAVSRPLLLRRTGSRLELTLARPARRNALSREMRDALVEAFELVAGDPGIAAIHVRGEGPDFCSGGDLAEFGTAPDPATAHVVRSIRQPAAALAACRERVSFHVHGACIGAGVELAAFGHAVTATANAWFQLPELSFGLIPGAGGCVSLARRIGRQRTAWLALSGRCIDAATARAWGLVDTIV